MEMSINLKYDKFTLSESVNKYRIEKSGFLHNKSLLSPARIRPIGKAFMSPRSLTKMAPTAPTLSINALSE